MCTGKDRNPFGSPGLRNDSAHDDSELNRAALLLSAIVDSSEDAIISKDLNGVVTSWNKSAERLFGYAAAQAIGRPLATLIIPPDRHEEEPNILARLRKGEHVRHFETVRSRKDGTLIDISLTLSPIRDNGEIVGISKIARDITEEVRNRQALKEANTLLMRANADLEHFAYSASHDLQEPLRMVSLYGQMLRRKFGQQLGNLGNEYIGYVLQGAARMDRLLHALRTYTQASVSGHVPAEVADAGEVLEHTLTSLKTIIEENDAEITYTPLPGVNLHEFQLEQLFQNIIGNAMRYRGPASPRIHVKAQQDGGLWQFSFQDNGIGIKPEYREDIFGIFKRLHTASEYPGTGMGLAICKRIVERAGGRMWVKSEPGRGSTFFFTLPGPGAA